MLGQTSQNATEPPKAGSLEQLAFEQRTRGLYSFRFATQLWYGLSMTVAKNRRIDRPVSIKGAAEAVHAVPASLATDRDKLPSARDWIHKAQADGYGVIVMPEKDGTDTFVKTKSAAVAERLTSDSDASFVLNEPKQNWQDVSVASLWVMPAFALVGIVAALLALETVT